ncbi:MAG TPA: hypothetical protein VM099_05175 [Gemmatimonadaceae bacterium]|nr:hypothetical protein [Gemmatimonadaceae bacterium]
MTRKAAILFILVCLLAGIGLFLGSVLGHGVSKTTGTNVGAIIGGIIGVVAATKIAVARKILGTKRFWPATIGAVLGLILAAMIATHHMSTPVVPLLSILIIGFGAVFGASSRHGKD